MLDKIDGAALANDDGAVVITASKSYTYILDATSGAAESVPDIVAPDTNPGTKRWILVAPELVLARIAGSTYSTVQHLQDIFHSAGWVSGGDITDDADGTITVAAGTGLIRATDTAVAEILFTDWAAESGANVNLADNDTSWVYVEYNGGSPQVVATITERTDFNTNILLAIIYREGTTLHINATEVHTVGDHANSMIRRLKGTMPYGHVSGGILSETGTRNIALTAGSFWRGLTEFSTSAVDTSGAPTFSYYYNNGTWQKVAAQSAIHQTNYNDYGVGLATLSNNRYGVHWVYLEADDDDIAVVYGIGDYTLAQAEDAQPPSSLPEHLQVEGILAGKIIIGKSDAVFTQVESAFQTKFTGSVAVEHNDTGGLQGGQANEYYHLTNAELAALGDEQVSVDAAATPGYLGIAAGDGVLRTGVGLTYADGGNFVTISPDIVGDGTAGRVLRIAQIVVADGTNANTIKCTLSSIWNGDADGPTDNITKGGTVGNYTLTGSGQGLRIDTGALSGDPIAAFLNLSYHDASGAYNPIFVTAIITGTSIEITARNASTGAGIDWAAMQDDASISSTNIQIMYLTDA